MSNMMTKFIEMNHLPKLWCPPLTHYTSSGEIDFERMGLHWRRLVRHVGGFLVPGTTGDGWMLNESETAEVIDFALRFAARSKVSLLLGALHRDTEGMRRAITGITDAVVSHSGKENISEAFRACRVCAITVCPPSGASCLQERIKADMESILDMGLPTALYQLPQVTENEIEPSSVAEWIERYPNLLLLKDSSGNDRIASKTECAKGRPVLLRGAEGEYSRWLKESGGPYHGLLVGSANCFASRYAEMLSFLEAGRAEEARRIAERLEAVIRKVFGLADRMGVENPFSNANRAVDHFMAHGPNAVDREPPATHGGEPLSLEFIIEIGRILQEEQEMPGTGYLYESESGDAA